MGMFSASTGKGLKSPGMFNLDRKQVSGAEGKVHSGMQKAGKRPEKFEMQVYDGVRSKKIPEETALKVAFYFSATQML